MRIGILGGTFDPVHSGHTALAQAALEKLSLDAVWLMPSGEPPHKKPFAGRADRLTMARLAAEDLPGVEVCEEEILRPGETYAADTLKALKKQYPDDEFVYILGSDAAGRVHKWKNAEKVMKLCSFACVLRAGAEQQTPEGMTRLEVEIADISSESIRARIMAGGAAGDDVPPKVAEYIARRGLYIAAMTEQEIIEDLRKRLKPSRFAHTMGVAYTAAELASLNGIYPGKAYIAGLLHDCAKNLSDEKLKKLAEVSGADEEEMAVKPVLHAPVGAYVAKERYGVVDNEVLCAIRRHTVGAEDMSLLDAIVYVADMIEPGRKYFDGLERARALARRDIFRAAALCGKLTRSFNKGKGAKMHPLTEKMIEKIENGGMNNG
ncbi:MAG: nicotinate-nucleotide adenylyltransferase [Clostridia bacterium]|nr:nicotinate-nucleotide adenylyltransferase [Clostridia bacterium]